MKLEYNYPLPVQNGEWVAKYIFIAGRISVDFAQTGGKTPERAYWERLHTPEDLAEWLAVSPLRLEGVPVSEEDLLAALELREAIWWATDAVRQGLQPSPQDVATLNRCAAAPELVPQLDANGSDARWALPASARAALSTIARDAIDLFSGEWRGRIRQCANPACQLVFVDQSRPGKRRWCVMERCGNLEKTRNYRHRQADKTME